MTVEWFMYAPAVVVLLVGALVLRWLAGLQNRVNDHAERVARIEGRLDDCAGIADRGGPP